MQKNDLKIISFSAPSGAGKTTIARYIEKQNDNLEFSVSATTRKKRGDEIDGKDYYFISQSKFRECVRKNEFVEWEEVYPSQYYGTLKSEIKRMWNEGKIPILDIDVIGALNAKKMFGNRILTIFVAPPSLKVLKERLIKRGTDDEESLRKRLEKAEEELSYSDQFDTILVNDVLEESFEKAQKLVDVFLKTS